MTQNQKSRNFCVLFLTLVLWCVLAPFAAAAEEPGVTVCVDGNDYPGGCLVRQGTTYLPMRSFFGFLGWTVDWDSASGCAVAEKDGAAIAVNPAAQTAQANEAVTPVPVLSEDGRVYLPLRSLAGLLGYGVSWEQSCRTAFLYTDTNGADGAVPASAAAAAYSADDLYWLSRIIHAEAQGESLAGQIAVGNVILNRVASPAYPDTIYDVIFDRNNGVQFTPVSNGAIYCTPSESSVTAARQALEGVNTAGGALFFFNPSLTRGRWIANNRTYFTTIGCHVFYL